MDAKNLADLYGAPLIEWSRVEARLAEGFTQAPNSGGPNRHTCWLTTVNPNGSPHVTAIGALWHDGSFWFETGGTTRKGKNLARDPYCALSVATDDFDLVIDGDARRVTDPQVVADMAARNRASGGWPCWSRRVRYGPDVDFKRGVRRPAPVVRLRARTSRSHSAGDGRTGRRHASAVLSRRRLRTLGRCDSV